MTIAEVSKLYEISADTLRYYERIQLIPKVTRNKNGIRNYTQEDLNWVEFIKCMRSAGISIEALIEYVELFQKGSHTSSARKDILIDERQKLRERMKAMQTTLKRLDSKIATYDDDLVEKEKTFYPEKKK